MSTATRNRAAGLALAVLAATGLALSAGAPPVHGQAFTPRDESPEEYPAHPNRDDAFYACTACHAFRLVAQQGLNRAQWDDTVQLMVSKHNMPALPDKDKQAVLDYLEATYPPRAPAGGSGGWTNPFAPK